LPTTNFDQNVFSNAQNDWSSDTGSGCTQGGLAINDFDILVYVKGISASYMMINGKYILYLKNFSVLDLGAWRLNNSLLPT